MSEHMSSSKVARFGVLHDLQEPPALHFVMSAADKVYEQLNTDPLTGLRNRHAFDEHLGKLVDGVLKQLHKGETLAVEPFVIFSFDADGLKVINDTQGHHAGDKAIIGIGNSLRNTMGEDCFLARTQGDEFAAVIGGKQLGLGDNQEEVLRSQDSSNQFNQLLEYIRGITSEFNVSVGAIVVDGGTIEELVSNKPEATEEETRDDLKRYLILKINNMADKSMYEHKNRKKGDREA